MDSTNIRKSLYNGYVKTSYPNPTYTIEVWINNECAYATFPVNFGPRPAREAFLSLLAGLHATEELTGDFLEHTAWNSENGDAQNFLRVSIKHGDCEHRGFLCAIHHIGVIDAAQV